MTARISTEILLEALAEQGLTDPDVALAALRATVAVLGERLVEDEAKALAEVPTRKVHEPRAPQSHRTRSAGVRSRVDARWKRARRASAVS
jgi:uncharacterized protein (DUF2267 family)